MDLSEVSIHYWINANQIKNEKGELIDLRDHYFLFDIYSDPSANLVVMKPAQVGLSTLEIIKMFYDAKRYKIDIIYTLPTDSDRDTFVGGKVNRIIAQNPVLQQYTSDKDTIEQKQVGDSMIYFRGTFTKKAAIMVTADRLVHDEKDSSKQDVVDEYQARLQHSKYKQKHVFSHPSVPGFGVHVEWEKSDQKHWFITCPHCKMEHFLEFPDSINFHTKEYVCKYCKGVLSNEDRRKGRWVAKYKDRLYSGYWISLLMAPWVSAAEIIDKFNDPNTSKEFFWNKILGLPYEGDDNTVSRAMIQRNIHDMLNEQEDVVIGSDSGLIKHYVVGNKQGVFFYGKTETWDDIEALLKRFPRSVLVLDALPDLTKPRELREKYPGRVFLCHYARDRKTMELIRWGKDKEAGNVVADRNRVIQLCVDEIKFGRMIFNGKAADFDSYIDHWLNIYRVTELDQMDRPVFIWKKKSTEDHWVHATVYWRIGMSKYGSRDGAFLDASPMDGIPSSITISPAQTVQASDPKNTFLIYPEQEQDWRSI